MDVLLRSAGAGTRLYPLTLDKPKCLLPVFGDDGCMLDYWIRALNGFMGMDRIYVNVMYLKEQVIEFIQSHPLRKNIEIYDEGERCHCTGHILNDLKKRLGWDILIVNSDTYIPKKKIRKFLLRADIYGECQLCIGVEWLKSTADKGVAYIDRYDHVIRFEEKPTIDKPGYVWTGMALLNQDFFKKLGADQLQNMEMIDLFQVGKMSIVETRGHLDMGGSLMIYEAVREHFKIDKIEDLI